MAGEFDYESIFGSDFLEIRKSLDQFPPEVERMLLGVMDSMIFSVDQFAKNLESTITQMAANQVNGSVITGSLRNDQLSGGRIFGQLKNDTKGNIAMGISNSGRIGQYENYTKKDLFVWVTVGGHKICIDCDGRGGMDPQPYAFWESLGVPGSGWSVCKGYCYCVLDPVGKGSEKISVDAKEVGAGSMPKKEFVPLNWHQANRLAKQVIKGAGASEKQITDMILKMSQKHDGVIEGLKYRLKGRSSTIRKIMKENQVNRWGKNSLIREDLNDLNRYTMLFDDAQYTRKVSGVIADMEAQGFKFSKVKNTWNTNTYKGINCNVTAPDGRVFELQFHTPESFRIKMDVSHPLYEKARKLSTTEAQKKVLNKQMKDAWDTVPLPNNVMSIEYRDLIQSIEYGDKGFTWDYYY